MNDTGTASTGAMLGIRDAIESRKKTDLEAAVTKHPARKCWFGGCQCDMSMAAANEFYLMVSSLDDEALAWLSEQLGVLPIMLRESVQLVQKDRK